MQDIEMLVSLAIADSTALTAANVLRKMGFTKLLNLKREAYYKFSIDGDSKSFSDRIAKVDILANANRDRVSFKKAGEPFGDNRIRILVRRTGDSTSELVSTLRNRLGIKSIRKIERGIMWTLSVDDRPENIKPIAWEIARRLLYNRHYQTAEIVSNQ